MQWRAGTVIEQVRHWPGAVECTVALDDAPGTPVRALAYTAMVGAPQPGERVLLNASALLKGLGTGGLAFVVARPDHLPADPPAGPGHIVKARYTPMQQMLLAVDEQDSPHHDALADADDLGGMPVVVADLHSAAAGGAGRHPRGATRTRRVAYVMTDGGALPVGVLPGRRRAGGCRVAGRHASPSGRPSAATTRRSPRTPACSRRATSCGADVAVVAQGPGQRRHGHPVGLLGRGLRRRAARRRRARRPRRVASLRVSGADPRERHRGISHHSRTAYGRALLTPADVPVTTLPDPELDALVRSPARRAGRQRAGRADGRRGAGRRPRSTRCAPHRWP